jgi:hypothetical protein
MKFQGFIGPSYKLNTVDVDAQRCINLYPQITESGKGKEGEVASLVSTPGLTLLTTLGSGPIRGQYTASNGVPFIVSGNTLYSLDSSFSATTIGTLNTATGNVSIADNGTNLVVVDGDYGYFHTLGLNSLSQISDPDFLGADQVVFQDGYFIFNKPDSGQFYITNLNSVSIDSLDIASSEGNPDDIVGLISDHRELWIFNENTTEVFYNSGNADFPFERIEGAYIEIGCAARWTIQKMNNSVLWVGADSKGRGVVYQATGFVPKRISTHAIEQAIEKYGDISSASSYTYQQNGHFFYVLNFSSANTTWVYDVSTGLWHERVFTNAGDFERHRTNYHCFAYNTHIVGDYENGKIYKLDSSVNTDDGEEITRQRVFPHISAEFKRMFFSYLQVDMRTGIGLDGATSTQGSNPQAILDWSDDGGYTWSNEKWASIGKIGKRLTRVLWRRLGQSRERVFRVTITDPNPITLISASLDVKMGRG